MQRSLSNTEPKKIIRVYRDVEYNNARRCKVCSKPLFKYANMLLIGRDTFTTEICMCTDCLFVLADMVKEYVEG